MEWCCRCDDHCAAVVVLLLSLRWLLVPCNERVTDLPACPACLPAWLQPSSWGYSSGSDSLGQSPTALWSAAPPTASSKASGSSQVSSLAIGLDPIGRIDANAADLLDWVARGR